MCTDELFYLKRSGFNTLENFSFVMLVIERAIRDELNKIYATNIAHFLF